MIILCRLKIKTWFRMIPLTFGAHLYSSRYLVQFLLTLLDLLIQSQLSLYSSIVYKRCT